MSYHPDTGRRLAVLAVGVLGAAAAAGSVVMYPSPVPALPASTPLRLEVPKIGVRTSLMPLAKNADQTVQVPPPDHAGEAGWYRLGPTPAPEDRPSSLAVRPL